MNITRGQDMTKLTTVAPAKLIISTTEPAKISDPSTVVSEKTTTTTTEKIRTTTVEVIKNNTSTPIIPIFNRIANDEDKSADMEISRKKHKRKTEDYTSTAESLATTIFGSTATTLFGFTTSSTERPTTTTTTTASTSTSTTVMSSVVPG